MRVTCPCKQPFKTQKAPHSWSAFSVLSCLGSLNDDLALDGPKLWNREFEDVSSGTE